MSALNLPVWAQASSRRVNADGISTHYFEMGSGPVLILIHGGGPGADSYGNWKGCLEAYAKNFRVIAYDMPGFGKSEKPSPDQYPYDQTSRNRHLIAFIEALGLSKVNLIGNSMGGATSIGVTLERPDLIDNLVLMGSAGIAVNNPDPSVKDKLRTYDFSIEGMRLIMETMTGSKYQIDPQALQYRHELMQEPSAQKAIIPIVRSDLTYPEDAVATIQHRTLVVAGKEDKIAVPARNLRYLELIENSWGVFIPHAGHWVMMESSKYFVDITTRFLLKDWE
ncbi:alpha/beta fold hydrolase [Pseudomonas asiatica]|uniref:alpha/beta fold hydrolase n=1 Tax=Pseudomonas asiatica TaxID=2219225 RepID=UPI0018A99930|nr:alpha/beta hydrolase [Pseudomonas asiatica]MBF8803523.1 alpha/beta fold hydrolase [Pseudomonas asiatica]